MDSESFQRKRVGAQLGVVVVVSFKEVKKKATMKEKDESVEKEKKIKKISRTELTKRNNTTTK